MNLHLCRAVILWKNYEERAKRLGPQEPLTLMTLAAWFDECERAMANCPITVFKT